MIRRPNGRRSTLPSRMQRRRCRTSILTTSNWRCWPPRRRWTPSPGTIGSRAARSRRAGRPMSRSAWKAFSRRSPTIPWAIHLYIHLVEASDRPERAEPYADRLAALMPGAGHIVHMPSHIYYRIGRYVDSLEANEAASKVDENYITQTGAVGVYPIGYYSHNVHFVLVSAQLLGDSQDRARRGRQARQVAEQRGRDGDADRPAGEGSPVLRLGTICRSRHDPGDARPAGRAALCEGDVALCARNRLRRQEGCRRRARGG